MSKRRGFTLIEFLVAFSLFLGLMAVVLPNTVLTVRSWRKIISRAEREQVRLIVLDRLCREIRSAQTVTQALPNTLTIFTASEEVSYSFVNGKVRRAKKGSTSYLTNEGEISRLRILLAGGQAILQLDGLTREVGWQ